MGEIDLNSTGDHGLSGTHKKEKWHLFLRESRMPLFRLYAPSLFSLRIFVVKELVLTIYI
jgi:hypothetical protein